MDVRVGLLFLLVLGTSWVGHARLLVTSDSGAVILGVSVMQLNYQGEDSYKEMKSLIEVDRNKDVCRYCEEYTAQAVDYLSDNKTQTEIIGFLHVACSRAHLYKHECISLVNHYAPLFFTEISAIQPGEFCRKLNLCENIAAISLATQKDSCELCHHTVAEALVKLKDPDTQLEILQYLLKACESVENYAKKCKRMVFEYAPLILANAEEFLETNDVCTAIHACPSPGTSTEQASSLSEGALVSDS